MFAILSTIALAIAAQAPGAVPAPPPSAHQALEGHVLRIEETAPGRYSGAGWDRLIADGAASHFFMIGEQHGVADIVKFAAAVHQALVPHGFTHAAYEVGPWSTDFAEGLIRSGEGKLATYLRQPGKELSLPFLFEQEEIDLAEQIVRLSPDKADALWGLDQEFIRSGAVVADLLTRWSRTPAERSAVDAFNAKLSANPDLVGLAPWAEMAGLETAFGGNAPAREFIAALQLSNEIYAPFTGRGGFGYDANLRRENYMKTNLVGRFLAAEERNGRAPKVFLKFGGYHAQKGFTGTNVPGLGNFLYEWGLARGLGFTNVMVECVGGRANNPIKGGSVPCQPYFSAESAIARLPKPNRLTLIDLRPLRPLLRRMTDLDPESRQLILSFDYYLAIKDVAPATLAAKARP